MRLCLHHPQRDPLPIRGRRCRGSHCCGTRFVLSKPSRRFSVCDHRNHSRVDRKLALDVLAAAHGGNPRSSPRSGVFRPSGEPGEQRNILMNIHNWHNGRARHETDAFEVPENAESAGEEEEERGEKCRSYAVKRSSQQESPPLPRSSHLPDPLPPPSSTPPPLCLSRCFNLSLRPHHSPTLLPSEDTTRQ